MIKTYKYLRDNISLVTKDRLHIDELKNIINNLDSFVNEKQEKNKLKEFFYSEYKTYKLTIDCLVLWNICATQIMLANSPELKTENSNLTNKGYFSQLLIHLTNNLIGVKLLFENGLAAQAKYSYRNSIELTDLAISILYDNSFFENHRTPNLKKSGNPFISPKNSTISKFAENVIEKVNNEMAHNANSSNVLSVYWKRLRKEQYEILSESAHGNYLHNILNTYRKKDNETFSPSLGCNEWLELERPLSDICLHQIIIKRYYTWILKIKHGIDLFDNQNELHKFIYFLDVVIAKKFLGELIIPQTDNNEN